MIIDYNEKLEIDVDWFEKQSKKDVTAWNEYLCRMLSVYKVRDEAGAVKAGKRMIEAGVNAELVNAALE